MLNYLCLLLETPQTPDHVNWLLADGEVWVLRSEVLVPA